MDSTVIAFFVLGVIVPPFSSPQGMRGRSMLVLSSSSIASSAENENICYIFDIQGVYVQVEGDGVG